MSLYWKMRKDKKKPLKLAFKLVCFDTNQYVRGGIVDYADSFKSHLFYLG